MQKVFVDTCFWIALMSERDDAHQQAQALRKQYRGTRLVTTDEVLTELLAAFRNGVSSRRVAVGAIRGLRQNPNVEVVEQSRSSFDEGLARYEQRLDKEFSHTDCVSMCLMERLGIQEVLTNDHHFTQASFIALMRNQST